MSAPELREAASLTRAAANKCCQCTDGHHRWTFIYGTEGDVRMSRDAAFAVATWLDSEADRLADLTHAIPNVVVSDGVLREWGFGHALDVARAYLGGAA